MDLFRACNNDKATAYDFYGTPVIQNTRIRGKDKKMLHKLARSRIKKLTLKEVRKLPIRLYIDRK